MFGDQKPTPERALDGIFKVFGAMAEAFDVADGLYARQFAGQLTNSSQVTLGRDIGRGDADNQLAIRLEDPVDASFLAELGIV